MATLLYLARILLNPEFGAAYPLDTYWFLLYVALDSQLVFRWYVWRHPRE